MSDNELLADDWLGEVRLKADDDVFIGIGRTDDVTRYLSGVEHDEVSTAESRVTYRHRDGGAPADPAAQTFWAASGTGEVTWRAEQGSWTAVMLNADRSRVIDTRLAAQAEVPALRPLSIGLMGAVFVDPAEHGLIHRRELVELREPRPTATSSSYVRGRRPLLR